MSKILMLKKSKRNKDVEDKNYNVKSLNRGKMAARLGGSALRLENFVAGKMRHKIIKAFLHKSRVLVDQCFLYWRTHCMALHAF